MSMHLLRLSWGIFLALIAITSWRGGGRQIEFIRNGNDAPLGKYPFFVGIHIRAYGLICGGTLVHPSGVVLTAGHCRNFGYGSLPLFMFTVEVNGKHYAVHSAKTHPSFDAKHPEDGSDLMLLYFRNNRNNMNANDVVHLNSDITLPLVNDVVSVAGYGLTSANWKARPSSLQEATDLEIVDCQDTPEWWFHEDPHLICTKAGPSQANVCTFDSGSPLFQNETTQIGILSLGDNDGQPLCSNIYAGLTPVAFYYDWIQENLPITKNDEEDRANKVE